jgi:hypothetical protein
MAHGAEAVEASSQTLLRRSVAAKLAELTFHLPPPALSPPGGDSFPACADGQRVHANS